MASYAHVLLDELKWPYKTAESRPSCAQFVLSMADGEIVVTAEGLPNSKTIVVFLRFALTAAVSKRREAAWLICKINNDLADGLWCIDGASGEIWLRVTMHGGTGNDAYLFDNFIQRARIMFSEWQKTIAVVLTSELNAEKAFTIKVVLEMGEAREAADSLTVRYKP